MHPLPSQDITNSFKLSWYRQFTEILPLSISQLALIAPPSIPPQMKTYNTFNHVYHKNNPYQQSFTSNLIKFLIIQRVHNSLETGQCHDGAKCIQGVLQRWASQPGRVSLNRKNKKQKKKKKWMCVWYKIQPHMSIVSGNNKPKKKKCWGCVVVWVALWLHVRQCNAPSSGLTRGDDDDDEEVQWNNNNTCNIINQSWAL